MRRRLGLLPNTEVELIVDGDSVRIVPVAAHAAESRGQRAVRTLRGTATVKLNTEAILAMTRGE